LKAEPGAAAKGQTNFDGKPQALVGRGLQERILLARLRQVRSLESAISAKICGSLWGISVRYSA